MPRYQIFSWLRPGGGVGWGVITTFGSRHRDYILTLWDFSCTSTHMVHTDMIPRYQIFSWLWPGVGWVGWGVITSFGSRHRDYILTLWDLLLRFHTYATLWDILLYLHTDMMPRYQIFAWLWPGGGVGWGLLGTSTHMLRYEIFSCACTPTWYHAIRSSPGSGLGWVGWGGVW